MATRRDARRLALQILFANQFLKENINDVALRVAQSLEQAIPEFTKELVSSTWDRQAELNQVIKKFLKNWELDRIAVLDRVILQIALNEMLHFPDIPAEVSINEAVELSKEFSTSRSRRFVNGILDAIYKKFYKAKIKAEDKNPKRGESLENKSSQKDRSN